MEWHGPELVSGNAVSSDQRMLVHGISWDYYDALLRARGESPQPVMAYLDGTLQIMTKGQPHEWMKTLLGRLIEAYGDAKRLELEGMGETTFRKKAKSAGLEPDECYCIGSVKAVPDLAVEIVLTSGGIDKLEIYRRLGVVEVWFVVDREMQIHRLRGDAFRRARTSGALRGIDLAALNRLLASSGSSGQSRIVREFRASFARRPRPASR